MKVYAWIKIAEHPQPGGPGAQKGDIVYFYPIGVPQGKETLNHYVPVVVDLKVPCGENFIFTARCNRCKFSTPDLCDIRKYRSGVWSQGTLEKPPTLLKKRRYQIDRSMFISGDTETTVLKKDKTEQEKALLLTQANNNEQLPSVIKEKKKWLGTQTNK